MQHTGLPVFDSTLQTTNIWLNDITDRLHWADKHLAYRCLRAALHALRDRLSVDQVAALGAQLPLLVRGIFYEGWHPAGKPFKERHKDEFLALLAEELHGLAGADQSITDVRPEFVARAVFQVLSKHVSAGEIESVKVTLPAELRDLWSDEPLPAWA
jgi:uncharacterized protein (DUF2267 family)